jgi:rRNA maturation endonuclease Nob1
MAGEVKLEKWRCPGVFREISWKACPSCGSEVEFFPQDLTSVCLDCGSEVNRDSSSCIDHCPARRSDCFREMLRHAKLDEMTQDDG